MNNFLLDVANLLTCLITIIIVSRLKIIPAWIGFVLILQSFTPYLLNDVLFPATYMPDQFKYFNIVNSIRNFYFDYIPASSTVNYASIALSLIPLPFVETIKSLGFYNRFIFIIMFVWLYRKKFLSGIPLYLLLFYPSLLLYTSLSLRDPLIMLSMVLSVVFFIEKKYTVAVLISLPLYLIKFQNFFLMLIFFLFFAIYRKETFLYRFRYIMLLIIIVLILPFLNEIITLLNFYRAAMFQEDGGDMMTFVPINDIYDFIILGITSGPYFLLKPFIWETSSLLQMIQSLENIIIFIILWIFTARAYRQDAFITTKWLIFILFSLSVYGLVVFNFGTAVRYKFPFVVIYIIGLSYELYASRGYKFGNFFK